MNERSVLSVSIDIPEIESLPDEKVAAIVHTRDGRWSEQTKSLLKRFGTTRLDLNRGWAATWQMWSCPCCRRGKPHIARLARPPSPSAAWNIITIISGTWPSGLIGNATRALKDRDTNIQTARAEHTLVSLAERFEETLICIDCNIAEGRAKLALGNIDPNFTFTPSRLQASSTWPRTACTRSPWTMCGWPGRRRKTTSRTRSISFAGWRNASWPAGTGAKLRQGKASSARSKNAT